MSMSMELYYVSRGRNMLKKVVAVVVVLLVISLTGIFFVSQSNSKDHYEVVSIYDLLTNFEELDRTKVTVTGYLEDGGGLLILHPTIEEVGLGDFTRTVYVHPTENHLKDDIRKCTGHYVRVSGFFMAHEEFRNSHVLTLVEKVTMLDENNKHKGYRLCAK